MSATTESTTQKRAHKDENGDEADVITKSQKIENNKDVGKL